MPEVEDVFSPSRFYKHLPNGVWVFLCDDGGTYLHVHVMDRISDRKNNVCASGHLPLPPEGVRHDRVMMMVVELLDKLLNRIEKDAGS